jgi:hypothetical protein
LEESLTEGLGDMRSKKTAAGLDCWLGSEFCLSIFWTSQREEVLCTLTRVVKTGPVQGRFSVEERIVCRSVGLLLVRGVAEIVC